jgi:hypothetical protein
VCFIPGAYSSTLQFTIVNCNCEHNSSSTYNCEAERKAGIDSHARALREEFRLHFMNISRIMDCVGCEKCRLWGKLQTHGMGTALKILFSDLPSSYQNLATRLPFNLSRNEVVALFQSFGRYSSSIYEVQEFRKAMEADLISQTSKAEL